MAKKKKKIVELSSEEKIRKAALKLFTQNGYAATKTRDISKEAGINLALLNYYFKSKEKLFDLVMTGVLHDFFSGISDIFNDEKTTVYEKVEIFVARYTALLKEQPELPIFIFREVKARPKKLASRVGVALVFKSYFFRQLQLEIEQKKIASVNPLHYVLNMISMCVFPFIAAPLLEHVAGVDARKFNALVSEREKLIPEWMKVVMKAK